MQQHGGKYFARRPPLPLTLGVGSKVQNSFFQNMVMLHIKLNRITDGARRWQLFCQQTPPLALTLGVGSKVKIHLFQKMVMLHIKLKTQSRMQQHGSKYFAHRPPCPTLEWGQKVKIQLFQKMVMLHIKLKGMEHRAPCKHIFSPYTRLKGIKI